jgi:hypothetical protein
VGGCVGVGVSRSSATRPAHPRLLLCGGPPARKLASGSPSYSEVGHDLSEGTNGGKEKHWSRAAKMDVHKPSGRFVTGIAVACFGWGGGGGMAAAFSPSSCLDSRDGGCVLWVCGLFRAGRRRPCICIPNLRRMGWQWAKVEALLNAWLYQVTSLITTTTTTVARSRGPDASANVGMDACPILLEDGWGTLHKLLPDVAWEVAAEISYIHNLRPEKRWRDAGQTLASGTCRRRRRRHERRVRECGKYEPRIRHPNAADRDIQDGQPAAPSQVNIERCFCCHF